MLKLIIGPSGSGKTAFLTDCIKADIEHGCRCFLLVPEQQAYISERDLLSLLPPNAGLYFEVVNFSGLAEAVFREYGGVTQGAVNKGLRTLLMWDTLRSLAPMLRQYGRSSKGDGTLPHLMLRTVEELRASGVDTDLLEDAASKLPCDSALQKKLNDLALIYAVFHERCEDCFGNDPSDKLLRMAAQLKEHRYFEHCNLYIDSFTSFTAQEYAVLREIVQQADTVTVSLCINDRYSALPHFKSTVKTAKQLVKIVPRENEVEWIQLPAQANKSAALRVLERDLWRFQLSEKQRVSLSEQEKSSVHLISAANLYEEAEAIALNILELVQGGMHYGDIAVVVRDTETYRGVLDAAMERYGIPYFLSERTDLSSKPLSRLILSALRAVAGHYPRQDVITLLKTGLTGVDASDAAMLEEYCETWHISGNRFTDDNWSMNPDGLTVEKSPRAERILEAANRARRVLIPPLERLSAALRLSKRIPDRCKALYGYLCELRISEQLSARAKDELARGKMREAGENVRLYRFMTDTLSTLCEIMPQAEVSVDEFVLALSLLFSETDLGSVPNTHDCVVIGSADTLRVENVKASFLAGLCEGEFPKSVNDDGILSENDKAKLEEFGIVLDSREDMRSSEELLYVYRAMTKPKEKLFLSTVSMQTDGSARTPSLAFSRAAFLLDQKIENFDSEAVQTLLDRSPLLKEESVLRAPVRAEQVTLRLSQSKIKTFVSCPYSYYSIYELQLREKKEARLDYSDDGSFLHHIFETFLKASLDADGRLNIPDEGEIEALVNEIVSNYIAKICPLSPEDTEKYLLHRFARLRQFALVMLRDILAELKVSRFVPTKFEQYIGAANVEDGVPAVTLELKNGSRVLLTGMIDRVDLYEAEDGKLYVRVVDYKTGEKKFRIDEVRSGMDIQLVLYLFAYLSKEPQKYAAGGAQYLYTATEKGHIKVKRSGFILENEEIKQAADASEKPLYIKNLTAQTADELQQLGNDMKTTVASVAERILAGEAQKTPSEDACRLCPVRTHCDKAYHG